jgi:maltodextrin utilization protein YvdJ
MSVATFKRTLTSLILLLMQKYIFLLVIISVNVEAAVLLWDTESCIAYFMQFRETVKILLNVSLQKHSS